MSVPPRLIPGHPSLLLDPSATASSTPWATPLATVALLQHGVSGGGQGVVSVAAGGGLVTAQVSSKSRTRFQPLHPSLDPSLHPSLPQHLMDWSPSTPLLAYATQGWVGVIDPTSMQRIATLEGHKNPITALRWWRDPWRLEGVEGVVGVEKVKSDGSGGKKGSRKEKETRNMVLASGDAAGYIYLWDVCSGTCLSRFSHDSSHVSGTGTHGASSASTSSLGAGDSGSAAGSAPPPLHNPSGKRSAVIQLVWLHNHLLILDSSGFLTLWAPFERRQLWRLDLTPHLASTPSASKSAPAPTPVAMSVDPWTRGEALIHSSDGWIYTVEGLAVDSPPKKVVRGVRVGGGEEEEKPAGVPRQGSTRRGLSAVFSRRKSTLSTPTDASSQVRQSGGARASGLAAQALRQVSHVHATERRWLLALTREILFFDADYLQTIGPAITIPNSRANIAMVLQCENDPTMLFSVHEDGTMGCWVSRPGTSASATTYDCRGWCDIARSISHGAPVRRCIQGVARHPFDPSEIAVLAYDGRVLFWRFEGVPRNPLRWHWRLARQMFDRVDGFISALATAPSSSRVAVGLTTGHVQIFDLATSALLRQYPAMTVPVRELCWWRDEAALICFGADDDPAADRDSSGAGSGGVGSGGGSGGSGLIALGDAIAAGSESLLAGLGGVSGASGGRGGGAQSGGPGTGSALCILDLHTGQSEPLARSGDRTAQRLLGIRLSPKGSYLIGVYKDQLDLWNLNTRMRVRTLPLPQVTAIEWCPTPPSSSSTQTAVSSSPSTAHHPATSVFDDDERATFLVTGMEGSLHFFSVAGTTVQQDADRPGIYSYQPISAIAWHENVLLTGDSVGALSVWRIRERQQLNLNTHGGVVRALKVRPQHTQNEAAATNTAEALRNMQVLVLFSDGDVALWDLGRDPKRLHMSADFGPLQKAVAVAWTSDGQPVVATRSGCLRVLDRQLGSTNGPFLARTSVRPVRTPQVLPPPHQKNLRTLMERGWLPAVLQRVPAVCRADNVLRAVARLLHTTAISDNGTGSDDVVDMPHLRPGDWFVTPPYLDVRQRHRRNCFGEPLGLTSEHDHPVSVFGPEVWTRIGWKADEPLPVTLEEPIAKHIELLDPLTLTALLDPSTPAERRCLITAHVFGDCSAVRLWRLVAHYLPLFDGDSRLNLRTGDVDDLRSDDVIDQWMHEEEDDPEDHLPQPLHPHSSADPSSTATTSTPHNETADNEGTVSVEGMVRPPTPPTPVSGDLIVADDEDNVNGDGMAEADADGDEDVEEDEDEDGGVRSTPVVVRAAMEWEKHFGSTDMQPQMPFDQPSRDPPGFAGSALAASIPATLGPLLQDAAGLRADAEESLDLQRRAVVRASRALTIGPDRSDTYLSALASQSVTLGHTASAVELLLQTSLTGEARLEALLRASILATQLGPDVFRETVRRAAEGHWRRGESARTVELLLAIGDGRLACRYLAKADRWSEAVVLAKRSLEAGEQATVMRWWALALARAGKHMDAAAVYVSIGAFPDVLRQLAIAKAYSAGASLISILETRGISFEDDEEEESSEARDDDVANTPLSPVSVATVGSEIAVSDEQRRRARLLRWAKVLRRENERELMMLGMVPMAEAQ